MRKLRVILCAGVVVASTLCALTAWLLATASPGVYMHEYGFGVADRYVARIFQMKRPSIVLNIIFCSNCARHTWPHAPGCDRQPADTLDLHWTSIGGDRKSRAYGPVQVSKWTRSNDWIVTLSLPVWLAVGTLLMPALLVSSDALRRWIRWRRRRTHGWCAVCGYDLQGLPEPKCPECGNLA